MLPGHLWAYVIFHLKSFLRQYICSSSPLVPFLQLEHDLQRIHAFSVHLLRRLIINKEL